MISLYSSADGKEKRLKLLCYHLLPNFERKRQSYRKVRNLRCSYWFGKNIKRSTIRRMSTEMHRTKQIQKLCSNLPVCIIVGKNVLLRTDFKISRICFIPRQSFLDLIIREVVKCEPSRDTTYSTYGSSDVYMDWQNIATMVGCCKLNFTVRLRGSFRF